MTSSKPLHVLYIDDDPDILLVTRLSLEKLGGMRVTTTECGREGVRLARKEKPDIIMVDLMMPEYDGTWVLRSLRSSPVIAGIPVIFVTAKQTGIKSGAYESMGVAGIIAKPFSPASLPDDVLTIWHKNRSHSKHFAPGFPAGDLQSRYLHHLAQREQEICPLLGALSSESLTDAKKQRLLQLLHNLAGSGATYGYPAISACARKLESAVSHGRDCRRPARDLLNSITAALAMSGQAAS